MRRFTCPYVFALGICLTIGPASNMLAQGVGGGQTMPPNTVYATAYGSGNSGITAAIAACATQAPVNCNVIIPPLYGSGGVPGSNPDPGYAQPNNIYGTGGNIPANVTVIDLRAGGTVTLENNEGTPGGTTNRYSNVATGTLLNCNHSAAAIIGSTFCQDVFQSPNGGGSNYNYYLPPLTDGSFTNASANVTNWQAAQFSMLNSTEGQAITLGSGSVHNGIGDTLGASINSTCHGGFVAHTDEGCEGMDLQVFQSGNHGVAEDFLDTVSSGGGGTGVTTVVLTSPASQGEGLQGAGRYLLDTEGVSPVHGSGISSYTSPSGSMPAYYTITGAATLPVSTFVAPLPLDIPVAGVSTPVTISSPTVGHVSDLSASSLLCIADQFSPLEFVKPSSVMGSTMHITTARPHVLGAIITSGGACGSFLSITADLVTSTTYPNLNVPVSGTMIQAWPVLETVASGSNENVYVAIQRQGNWGNVLTQENSSNNSFSVYPGAEVTSVANTAGMQSDTFTLSPNNVVWNNGDTVDLPDHPSVSMGIGQWLTQAEFPGQFNGFGVSYYGAVQGISSPLAGFTNYAPNSLYHNHGGNWDPPTGLSVGGELSYDVAGGGADVSDMLFGCSFSCDSPGQKVLVVNENGGRSDTLYMDEGAGQWDLTANNGTMHYRFRIDGLEMLTEAAPTAAQSTYAKLNFNSNFQVCLMDNAGSNHCAVQGPSSSTTYDVATFNGTTGTIVQDSGVSISPYNTYGQWINLTNAGTSGIGTDGPGGIVFGGYTPTAGLFFTDTAAGDNVIRAKLYSSIRLGVKGADFSALSTMQVGAAVVTLSLGTKLTETSGLDSNATSGFAALSSGTASVATSAIGSAPSGGSQSGDVVELTLQSCNSCGVLYIQSVSSGSGFVIKSSNTSDSSSVYWMIHHLN